MLCECTKESEKVGVNIVIQDIWDYNVFHDNIQSIRRRLCCLAMQVLGQFWVWIFLIQKLNWPQHIFTHFTYHHLWKCKDSFTLTHTLSQTDKTTVCLPLCVCFLGFCAFQCQSYLCAGLVLPLCARAALALHLSSHRHFISVQGVHAGSWGTSWIYTGPLGLSFLLADCTHRARPPVLHAAGWSRWGTPEDGGGDWRWRGGRRGRLTCCFVHAERGFLQLRGNVIQGDIGGHRAGVDAAASYRVGWRCSGTATSTSCWGSLTPLRWRKTSIQAAPKTLFMDITAFMALSVGF